MSGPDPLSRLLQTWRPSPPQTDPRLVPDTMRAVRQSRQDPAWKRVVLRWTEVLEEWAPVSPAWLPVAASIIFLLAAFKWDQANDQGRTLSAARWQHERIQPLSRVSLTGAYLQSTKE